MISSKQSIVFACDNQGFELKKKLLEYAKNLDFEIKDVSIEKDSSKDYIEITRDLINEFSDKTAFGIIVSSNAQGTVMIANRHNNMRAVFCRSINEARDARIELNANILCLENNDLSVEEAIEYLNVFRKTNFNYEKYEKNVSKLSVKTTDHTFTGINLIVRAIITHKNHVLLSTVTQSNTQFPQNLFFLPGGHVDYKESAIEALKRELKEEMNVTEINNVDFVNVLECTWNRKGKIYHEINLTYKVEIKNLDLAKPPLSTESSLRFLWCPLNKIEDYKILPEKLTSVLLAIANPQKKIPLFLSEMLK